MYCLCKNELRLIPRVLYLSEDLKSGMAWGLTKVILEETIAKSINLEEFATYGAIFSEKKVLGLNNKLLLSISK